MLPYYERLGFRCKCKYTGSPYGVPSESQFGTQLLISARVQAKKLKSLAVSEKQNLISDEYDHYAMA